MWFTNDARGSSFKCFYLRSSEVLQLWWMHFPHFHNLIHIRMQFKWNQICAQIQKYSGEIVKYKYKRTGRQGRPKVRRIGGMFALHVISSPTDQCSRLFFTNIINTNTNTAPTKLHLLVSSLFMQIYLCILHPIYSEHYFCTFTFVLIDDSSCYKDICIRNPYLVIIILTLQHLNTGAEAEALIFEWM